LTTCRCRVSDFVVGGVARHG